MDTLGGGQAIGPFRAIFRRGRRPASPSPIESQPVAPPPTPIHKRDLDVNPQSSSRLYNGHIPPEIRDQIFFYALTEYPKTDEASQYPESSNYTRPGYTSKRTISTGLLLACRRTYLETYHLPMVTKEHVFWHERWPPGASTGEEMYFRNMLPWQLKMVKELHLFTQLHWLEQTFPNMTQSLFMQGIEKLKITVRRGDWWYNETNKPLAINPQRGNGDGDEMRRDWQKEKAGEVIPWDKSSWSCAFANMASLKELELELETSEDKVPELKVIVEKGKTWKFPMKDGMVLSAEGLPVRTSEWRSKVCYWSQQCPYCSGEFYCQRGGYADEDADGGEVVERAGLEKCKEKKALMNDGLGPMCTVFTLRYRLAKGEGLR